MIVLPASQGSICVEALIALRAVACNYHEVLVPHWDRLLSLAECYCQAPAGATGIPTASQSQSGNMQSK